jgi:hypothetical protein
MLLKKAKYRNKYRANKIIVIAEYAHQSATHRNFKFVERDNKVAQLRSQFGVRIFVHLTVKCAVYVVRE